MRQNMQRKLDCWNLDTEDARIATIIREEIEMIALREFLNEIKIGLHGNEMEYNMKHDIFAQPFRMKL